MFVAKTTPNTYFTAQLDVMVEHIIFNGLKISNFNSKSIGVGLHVLPKNIFHG
jgi:hypothetical protein